MRKTFLSCLIISNVFLSATTQTAFDLSAYAFNSASVLPTCLHQNKKWVILGRETKGKYCGYYDNFGGGREEGEDDPVATAAREFFEEAVLLLTVSLTLKEIERYIDETQTDNTEVIFAYNNSVTYITDFTYYTKTLLKNFYKALQQTTAPHFKEKDRIALIQWDKLEKAIKNSPTNFNVTVDALELDPATLQFTQKTILLRPYFVKQLKPFFTNKPYKQGTHNKIRFYD